MSVHSYIIVAQMVQIFAAAYPQEESRPEGNRMGEHQTRKYEE